MNLDMIPALDIFNKSPLLKQIAILVIYAVIAKIVDLFIDRVLRNLAKKTSMSIDDALIKTFHLPVAGTVFFVGVLHALLIQQMGEPWDTTLPALTKSIILVIWWVSFIRFFNILADKNVEIILSRGKIGNDLFYLLKNIVRVVIIVMGMLWLLSIWQIDLTPLFASAGIAGIAIALAAKDSLANFFGGISIFMDKTFKVGDYIIIDSGERGEVVEVGIRSTRIKTRDDVLITIPNSIMSSSKIINESAPIPRFRIRIPFGVAYGSDLDKVEEIVLKVAADNPGVSKEPSPRVRLRTFGTSSVDFELLLWVPDPSLKGLEVHNLLKTIYREFYHNDIVIPFPQVDVHLQRFESDTKGQQVPS